MGEWQWESGSGRVVRGWMEWEGNSGEWWESGSGRVVVGEW